MRPDFFRGFDAMRAQLVQQVPVRVLWGDSDPYISTDYAQSFGSANVSILPGVGLWVPLLAPEQLTAEVDAFS